MNIVSVRNLKVRFKNQDQVVDAIRDISFDIEQGDFVSLIGLNQHGKTSLLLSLNGIIPHFIHARIKGNITVDGINVAENKVSYISQRIGFVFDNPFNQISYTTETVKHEIAFGLCNIGMAKKEIEERVEETAALVGISNLLDRSPYALSGGQLQRLAIASVIVMKPKILMLDDCTSQLDPLGSQVIFDLIEKLNQAGMTIISVDHDLERVCHYSNKVIVLHEGKIIHYDSPSKVFDIPNILQLGIKRHSTYSISSKLIEDNKIDGELKLTFKDLKKDIMKLSR